jgi:cell division protein FtsB
VRDGSGVATRPKPATRMERRRAISRRRARLATLTCLGFCVLVLATSFPVSALVRQHRQISAATAELRALTTGNQSLERQARALSQSANVAALARQEYDLVHAGQKAYTVLPLPGSLQSPASSSGHSSLDQGPVAPGSGESEALLGDGEPTGTGATADTSGSQGAMIGKSGRGKKSASGLWSRVLGTLEFWR